MKSFACLRKIAQLSLVAVLLTIMLVFWGVSWTAFAAGLPQEIPIATPIQLNGGDNVLAGVVVSPDPASTYDLTEAAGASHTRTFSVKLTSQPTADVVVHVANLSSRTSLDKVSQTFTSVNWNTTQSFTVTAADNAIADGDLSVSVNLSLTSADPIYDAHFATAIQFIVIDNDVAGITIAPDPAVTYDLTEAAGVNHSRIFTVDLNSQPTADVVVHIANATARTSLDKNSLTFTSANWNTPQLFTVTAVDNLIADGDAWVSVNLSLTSMDLVYHNKFATSFQFAISDNDVANLNISPDPNVTYNLTEAPGVDNAKTFSVVLNSQPTANVVISITKSSPRILVDKTSLTFTAANWNTTQNFTVTAYNDNVPAGELLVTIDIALASTDSGYDAQFATTLSIHIIDATPGLVILPDPSLTYQITEAPGSTFSKAYSIKLSTKPTANVVVTPANASGRITWSPASLTFTPTNWNTNQTFTVSAVDNAIADGDAAVQVGLTLVSTDVQYGGLIAPSLMLRVIDNDTPGIRIDPTPNVTYEITESSANHTRSFGVNLTSQPIANVVITITNPSVRLSLDKTNLTFTTTNWNTPQSFTLTAVDNTFADGDVLVSVDLSLTSVDPSYSNKFPASISLKVIDNDVAGLTISPNPAQTYDVTEGTTKTFSLKLSSQPTSNVTITLTRNPINDLRFGLDKTSLTYTPANWSTVQTFTVTTIENTAQEPNLPVTITLSPASTDGLYNNLALVALHLSVINDDFYMYLPKVVRDPDPLLYDNFGTATNWTMIPNSGSAQAFDSGQLLLSQTNPFLNTRSIAPLAAGFARPYSVETTTWVPIGAPANIGTGILFDYLDGDHFYRFLIDPTSRTYWLQKYTTSGYVDLVPSAVSNAILSGNNRNHLKLIRHAGSIEVYINGQYVTYANDGAFMTGQVGLIMRAPSNLLNGTTAQARFEDYLVLKVTAPVYQDLLDSATRPGG